MWLGRTLTVIGLLLGFIGGLLVTVFGLPSIGVLSAGMYSEIEITPRIKIYNFLSKLGLLLVMAGFVLQLIQAVEFADTHAP